MGRLTTGVQLLSANQIQANSGSTPTQERKRVRFDLHSGQSDTTMGGKMKAYRIRSWKRKRSTWKDTGPLQRQDSRNALSLQNQ